jgi:hypothetical protein
VRAKIDGCPHLPNSAEIGLCFEGDFFTGGAVAYLIFGKLT